MSHIAITQTTHSICKLFTFNPHLIHLFVTTFLTLFLKVFNLKGKDARKYIGLNLAMATHDLLCKTSIDKGLVYSPKDESSMTRYFCEMCT
jgi:hypothetical protein